MHGRGQYRNFESGEDLTSSVKAFLLVQVDEDGRAESNFRFTLEGRKIEADFSSGDIFRNRSLSGFTFKLHVRAEEIELKQNGLSSKWEDLDEQVAKGLLLTTEGSNLDDGGPDFRAAYATAKEKGEIQGAALRWSLQGRSGRTAVAAPGFAQHLHQPSPESRIHRR